MRSRWSILALLCVLASLLVPGIASANSSPGAENRVWDFSTQEQVCAGSAAALTLELRPGCALAYDDGTSGSLLAAKGGGKLAGKGRKKIGNMVDIKDMDAAEAIRERGGNAGNVKKALGNSLRGKTVGEIANMAGAGDRAAETALKIIKQAAKKGGK